MSASFDIAICICTYNRYDLLPKAIESALAQRYEADHWRVLVIDNSPDERRAREEAAKYKAEQNLSYIVERTAGLSHARNVGAAACDARYIAFMDDDAIADPDWLTKLMEAFQSGAAIGAVGGRVDPIWPVVQPAWVTDRMEGALSIINWGGALRPLGSKEWLAGTNIAFDVSTLLASGGFQTSLGRIGSGLTLLSNEESAVVEYLASHNFQVLYAPEAVVQHLVDHRRLTKSWFRKRAAWQAASDFLKDPEHVDGRAAQYWDNVVERFGRMPPVDRTPRGFFVDTDDAAEFQLQLDSIYNMTVALLAGHSLTPSGDARS
ncbi:MAG: glycosyltransferase [Pseudomonadota bacterium]